MLPAPNPPSDLPSATVSLGEEEEEEGDTFVLGAFSPAGRVTARAFSPAGQETARAFTPAGQEGYDIRVTSGKLESNRRDSAVVDRKERGDGTSAETERKNNSGRVLVSSETVEDASLKELTAKDVGKLTGAEPPGPKDQPRPNLALVPLTETAHSFVVDTTHGPARPSGSTQLSGRLQTEVVSNASGPSCPPEENLSEGERGADGEVTVVESNARPMALAPKEEEEEQNGDQHATFPCLPPDPVCVPS